MRLSNVNGKNVFRAELKTRNNDVYCVERCYMSGITIDDRNIEFISGESGKTAPPIRSSFEVRFKCISQLEDLSNDTKKRKRMA